MCVLLALEVSNTTTILEAEACTLSIVMECCEYINSPRWKKHGNQQLIVLKTCKTHNDWGESKVKH